MRPVLSAFTWALLGWLLLASPAGAVPLKEDYASYQINFAAGQPITSGVYDPTDPYLIGAQPWVANLLPLKPIYLRTIDVANLGILTAAFPVANGWSYASAVNELSDDSILIHTYDVQGTPGRVGAEFHVEYAPQGTDPTTDIHWIQIIHTNHSLRNPPGIGHGTDFDGVDNPFSPGNRSPYYDDGGAATGRHFYDFPGRTDAGMSHFWLAELYLVTGPAADAGPGLITFLGGVQWGWENHPVPEPGTLLLLGSGLAGLGLVAWRRRRAK